MNRDSMQKLRLDRRLIQRRGWISEQERDAALESLPDTADKLMTLGEAEDQGKAGEDESAG